MSLQEAASSGSFEPRAAQPSEHQRIESPFDPPLVDQTIDQAVADPTTPFRNPFDLAGSPDDAQADSAEPDMRATRRRAWTVVGLAIVIPAAVAALIAWQLFGGNSDPTPTVTRVTTTPAETVSAPAATAAPSPVQATTAAVTAAPAATTESTAAVAATTAAADTSAAAVEPAESSAAATAEAAVDLSSLDPAARLAAWTDLETIQVLPGETLWLIAQNYNTTISAITTLNGITDPETLSIGQELVIPVGFTDEVSTAVAAVETESSAAADGAQAASTDASSLAVTDELAAWPTIAPVLIEPGDSLAAIAAANDTTVEAIMAINGIADAHLIFVGDTLLVPVGYQGETPGISVGAQQTSLETSADSSTSESATAGVGADDGMMEEEGANAGGDMMEE